jgi:hypothetical protein
MTKKEAPRLLQKPKPFIAPGSETPITSEEIKKREKRIELLELIGEHPTRVTDDEFENPYRLKAIALISEDKDIPEELLEQIKKFDEAHYMIKG